MGGSKDEKLLYCSFCGKSQHEVGKLIAGPSVFICNECVGLCNDIIEDELSDYKKPLPKTKDCVINLCKALDEVRRSTDLILGKEYSCLYIDEGNAEQQSVWQQLYSSQEKPYSQELRRLENSDERSPEIVEWSERWSPEINGAAKLCAELEKWLFDNNDDDLVLYDMLRELALMLDGLPTATVEANDIAVSNRLEPEHRFFAVADFLKTADEYSWQIHNLVLSPCWHVHSQDA